MSLSEDQKKDPRYVKLTRQQKSVVERAFAYAAEGDYRQAIGSFVSDRAKINEGGFLFDFKILEAYTKSKDQFFEGLLGFYWKEAEELEVTLDSDQDDSDEEESDDSDDDSPGGTTLCSDNSDGTTLCSPIPSIAEGKSDDSNQKEESDYSDGATLCSPTSSIAVAGLDKTLQLRYSNVLLHSYGNPYWWFLCKLKNAIFLVQYNPVAEKINRKIVFGTGHTFKSMIAISDRVYLLHQDGRILSSAHWEYDNIFHDLKKTPVALLGGSKNVLVVQCEDSVAFVPFGFEHKPIIYPYARSKKRRLQAHNFDADKERLLFAVSREDTGSERPSPLFELQLIRKPNRFTLKVKKHALQWLEGGEDEESWDETFWKPVAISKHGDVAFGSYEGDFVIINPFTASKTASMISVGNSLENNYGGPSCFAGDDDQYFMYCGVKYAEIAGVKLVANDWGSQEFCIQEEELAEIVPVEEDADRVPVDDGDSFIRDPGFDGKRFIVRVKTKRNSVLCTFSLD